MIRTGQIVEMDSLQWLVQSVRLDGGLNLRFLAREGEQHADCVLINIAPERVH